MSTVKKTKPAEKLSLPGTFEDNMKLLAKHANAKGTNKITYNKRNKE